MDLSGYQANIIDGHGYFVDSIRRQPTLAEAQAAAEQRYEAKGWTYAWYSDTGLVARSPQSDFQVEKLRIYQQDAKGNMIF